MAYGSTVEMAVHQVDYQLITMLREQYACLGYDTSPYRFLLCGYRVRDAMPFTRYPQLEAGDFTLRTTADFAHHKDSLTQLLVIELARVRQQLHQALIHLAAHTTEFASDECYVGGPLPAYRRLPDVGGYVPTRGPLISSHPPCYGQ